MVTFFFFAKSIRISLCKCFFQLFSAAIYKVLLFLLLETLNGKRCNNFPISTKIVWFFFKIKKKSKKIIWHNWQKTGVKCINCLIVYKRKQREKSSKLGQGCINCTILYRWDKAPKQLGVLGMYFIKLTCLKANIRCLFCPFQLVYSFTASQILQ